MALGPSNRYVHSAYQVCDLDAIAAGSQYLKTRGYHHSWGIGRPHPGQPRSSTTGATRTAFLVEHYADGDMFDCTLEPGSNLPHLGCRSGGRRSPKTSSV